MSPAAEPIWWAQMRTKAIRDTYRERRFASPTDILEVDAVRDARGQLPSLFGRNMTRVAAALADMRTRAQQQAQQTAQPRDLQSNLAAAQQVDRGRVPFATSPDPDAAAGRTPATYTTPSAPGFAPLTFGADEVERGGGPNMNPLTGAMRAVGDVYTPLRESSTGFFTGSNPAESVSQSLRGLLLQEDYDEGQLGFVRHMEEGDRGYGLVRAATETLTDPITLATAGLGPAISGAVRGVPFAGRGLSALVDPVIASRNPGVRLLAETAVGTGGAVAAGEAAERTDNPALILGAGLLGGVGAAGGLGAARAGIRGVDNALGEAAIREAAGPTEAATRGVMRPAEGAPGAVQPATDAPFRSRVVGAAEGVAEEVAAPSAFEAPPTVQRLYGVRPIEEGSQRGLGERLARSGRVSADDPVATPALLVRAEARQAVGNQATQVAERARAAINTADFEFDDAGRITRLAGIDPEVTGAPTLRDVAARLPRYEPYLTDTQMETLEAIRDTLAPYRQALDEVAAVESSVTGKPSTIDVGSRSDVMEGGFYIPRGTAETAELAEIASRRSGGGGRRGGRQGFEQSAGFPSEAAGIEAGYGYTPVADAIGSYVRGIGNRTLDRHAANYFLTRVDDTGQALATTAADRVDPQLRGAVESLRSRISGRAQTLRNQSVRGTAQQGEAARAGGVAERAGELAENAEARAERVRDARTTTRVTDTADDMVAGQRVVEDTDGILRAAERELSILERQANQAGRRAETSASRAVRTANARQAGADELAALRTEYDALNQRWQQAQAQARPTPRDRGSIPIAGLEGRAFPWEIADEAQRMLKSETRDPAAALRALNSMLRGVQATGEMSYLGIQGAIAMASGNRAWRRAAGAATRAWGNAGENALGNHINAFDAARAVDGRPTVERWASVGGHLGGSNTEFAVRGRGIGGRAAERAGEAITNVPVAGRGAQAIAGIPRRADRGFGTFGDVGRLEMWDLLAEESLAAGRTLDDAELRSIVDTGNRVTGWSPTRAGGDVGEMLNFAPRYLAARIESLAQLGSKDVRRRQLARRMIGRYVGLAALLTIAANEALGEETDWRPFSGSKGPTWNPLDAEYKNPNFMRIRNVGGRDWSLLGPVDSTLGVVIGAGSMLTNPTGDPKEALDRMRSVLTAPMASAGMDWLVFGENFEGEELDNMRALGADLLERVVPFAAPEAIASGFDVKEEAEGGNLLGAASEAAGGLAQAGFGFRGSPVTIREQVLAGGYRDLEGRDQFRGIPSEVWRAMSDVESLQRMMGDHENIYQWQQDLRTRTRDELMERGLTRGQAETESDRLMSSHPLYKQYLDLRAQLRTRWVMENPEEAIELWDQESAKPWDDRDWTPTKEQREIMDFYLASQRPTPEAQ